MARRKGRLYVINKLNQGLKQRQLINFLVMARIASVDIQKIKRVVSLTYIFE